MSLSLARNTLRQPSIRALNTCQSSRTFTRAQSTTTKTGTKPPFDNVVETSVLTLTWPEYLAIKRSKRTWQMIATVPCAFIGLAGGLAYFGSLDTDPFKPIMGIDPFFFYGICTVGTLGTGALIGPSIGTYFWRVSNRRVIHLLDAKDREFFQRIAKHRIDASLQSPTGPVPDYYGEKIGSLHDYRQWLRDQAKYRRKALLPEEL